MFAALVGPSMREKSRPEMCLQITVVSLNKTQPFVQIANLQQKNKCLIQLKKEKSTNSTFSNSVLIGMLFLVTLDFFLA